MTIILPLMAMCSTANYIFNHNQIKSTVMKKSILSIIICLLFSGFAIGQTTVKTDSKGNYVAVAKTDTTSGKPTGKTFTDSKGIVYPVMLSKNGKLYVVRTSKAGNKYHQYLKVN